MAVNLQQAMDIGKYLEWQLIYNKLWISGSILLRS